MMGAVFGLDTLRPKAFRRGIPGRCPSAQASIAIIWVAEGDCNTGTPCVLMISFEWSNVGTGGEWIDERR
jgi:hypothetical protein